MKPRIGFLGTGWIGRNRMEALLGTGLVEPVAICDPSPECLEQAGELAVKAQRVASLDEMLEGNIDGVVIATPSALHAAQSIQALAAGKAVFCQKPLGRTAQETLAVVNAARNADRLLGVDLSYRHTEAMKAIGDLVRSKSPGSTTPSSLAAAALSILAFTWSIWHSGLWGSPRSRTSTRGYSAPGIV